MYAGPKPKVMMIMTSALWNIVTESEMDMGWVHPWVGLGWVGLGWVGSHFPAHVMGWVALG